MINIVPFSTKGAFINYERGDGWFEGGGGGAEMLPEHRGENLKYLTSKNIKHLAKNFETTDASDHKLQSTENFIDAIKTVQIPNNHRLVSFDVKSLFTSIPLQLALDCTGTLLQQTADDTPLPLPNDKIMDLLKLCLESHFSSITEDITNSYMVLRWDHRPLLLLLKLWCSTSRNEPLLLTIRHYIFGSATSTIL